MTFPSDMVGDFVLIRSTGMPVYNFCCTVDDHLMNISHVFRAEEHLSNTLRQIMIYEAFDWSLPEFGHLSIILGEDRQKLSKRHGATSVSQYREDGFLPEALNNFLALLGWSSPEGKELMTMEEMSQQFGTKRLHSAAAVFDEKKLKWFNATYLRELPFETLWSHLSPLFAERGLELPSDPDWQKRAVEMTKTSMETLTDGVALFEPLSRKPLQIGEEALEVLSWESSAKVIENWKKLLEGESGSVICAEKFGDIQNQIKDNCAVKGKHLFMPIRTAVVGRPHGAELKILVPLLDREVLIERANQVLARISQGQG